MAEIKCTWCKKSFQHFVPQRLPFIGPRGVDQVTQLPIRSWTCVNCFATHSYLADPAARILDTTRIQNGLPEKYIPEEGPTAGDVVVGIGAGILLGFLGAALLKDLGGKK